jgi:hypothetical protein
LAKDFSIIIAHRGSPLGLWSTIHSCEIELSLHDIHDQPISYEYRICINGVDEIDQELGPIVDFLRRAGKLGKSVHSPEPLAPPIARNKAVEGAEGNILAFLDNHCLVYKDYFRRAALDFECYDMDILHSRTRFYTGELDHYHYHLTLGTNFWGKSEFDCVNEFKPYRIAMCGHGGFFVSKKCWDDLGGYWDGFVGYGGEEPYLDLLACMTDKKIWLDPQIIHYHFAGNRGYARHFTDDYFINMMSVAYIIGGTKWVDKVYASLNKQPLKRKSCRHMYELYLEALERSEKQAQWVKSVRKRSLDEQFDKFVEEGVEF